MNLRETILSADDLGSEIVIVPEWGVTVEIRGLTVAQRAQVMETAYNSNDKIDAAILNKGLIVACLYDPETKEPIFTIDDGDAILKKNSDVIERLCKIATRLSGIGSDSSKDAEKN